jgi:hypothetical protein
MNDTIHSKRPGAHVGQTNEFTIFARMKPGGAERMRKLFDGGFTGERQNNTDRIGTVHSLRFVFFDDDTRMMFCSSFDGDWESYINDFASIIPDEIDLLFEEVEGWPGISDPGIKDFIAAHQVTAAGFYTAFPDATVRDIWRALKVKKAFDNLLDQAQS